MRGAGIAPRRSGSSAPPATAAAGKLIGLRPEEMLAAFGIAYSQAAGNRQCILDGGADQADAGRPGGKRGRFLGRERLKTARSTISDRTKGHRRRGRFWRQMA
jgi:hypothetical protein